MPAFYQINYIVVVTVDKVTYCKFFASDKGGNSFFTFNVFVTKNDRWTCCKDMIL